MVTAVTVTVFLCKSPKKVAEITAIIARNHGNF
jgi:hypothetical protein